MDDKSLNIKEREREIRSSCLYVSMQIRPKSNYAASKVLISNAETSESKGLGIFISQN